MIELILNSGRMPRLPFFLYQTALIAAHYVLNGLLLAAFSMGQPVIFVAVMFVVVLSLYYVEAFLVAKRLHDLGRHGGHAIWIVFLSCLADFIFILLSPMGMIAVLCWAAIILYLVLAPGQSVANAYGPPTGLPAR